MITPRYVGSEGSSKFGAILRERVNAYFKDSHIPVKGDARLVPKVVSMLALFMVPWILVLSVEMNVWVALLMVIATGAGMAGVGMTVMHDALHGASSKHPWLNKLLGGSMYLLGSDVFAWKIQHNVLHHTHTNVDMFDQDIESRGILRFSEHAPLKRVHRFQHVYAFFFYGLLTITKLVNDFFMLAKVARSGVPGQKVRNVPVGYATMIGVKLTHVFVFIALPIWVTPFTWWQVVLGFLVMHFTAGLILGSVFQLAHVVEGAVQPTPDTAGVIASDWTVHELLTTSDFAPKNRVITWFTGGLNYQIEHHLFPYISHLHYASIAPIVQRTAQEFGLPYNVKPTMWQALRSHVRRLWQLGHPADNTQGLTGA
ncbi:MAG: acyl-CoA desaturase [Flavobacteriales bacterium]